MSDLNFDFDIVALIVAAALSIYTWTKYSSETQINRNFRFLVMAVFIYALVDFITLLTIDFKLPHWLMVTITTIDYCFDTIIPIIYLVYVKSYIYTDRKELLRHMKIAWIIYYAIMMLIFLNLFFGFVFKIDDGKLIYRPMNYVVKIILPAFFIMESFYCLYRYSFFYSKMQEWVLILFGILIISIPIIQIFISLDYQITAYAYTFIMILLLTVIETPDQQELFKTLDHFEALQHRLENSIKEKTEEAENHVRKMDRLSRQLIYVFADTIDAKDRYTSGHSSRVAHYSKMIALKYGMAEEDAGRIYMMGILHDIGKVGISKKIITKPKRLSDEEYEIMKDHTVIGAKILEKITMFPSLSMGARWHHERLDGSGYPDGLKNDEIPEEVRIICVADAYDAMTSYRSYRTVMPQDDVCEQLLKGRGSQFDPAFVDIMVDLIRNDTDYRMREPHPEIEDKFGGIPSHSILGNPAQLVADEDLSDLEEIETLEDVETLEEVENLKEEETLKSGEAGDDL